MEKKVTILVKDNNSTYLDLIVQERIFDEIPDTLLISQGMMADAKYMCANSEELEYFKSLDSDLSFDNCHCDYLRIYTVRHLTYQPAPLEGM